MHIHQSFFAFLHNRDILENGGVFVTRARSLASLAPKGNIVKTGGPDLSKMNPTMAAPLGGMVGSGAMGRGPRDRDIGLTVCVVKGPHKGYVGTIKDTNGPIARVELRTGNKVITLEKNKLRERLCVQAVLRPWCTNQHNIRPNGKLFELTGRGSSSSFNSNKPPNGYGGAGPRTPNPYTSGSRTPSSGVGRTPNPYAGDPTPSWNPARTPNPYADGSKTPAWNASSQTPNPYVDGAKTPAWNANSKTPNPYVSGGGGTGWGGATPGRNVSGWGGATPARTSGWGGADSWGNDSWVCRFLDFVLSVIV